MKILAQAAKSKTIEPTKDYSHGEFDGITGAKPNQALWAKTDYKTGYLAGLTKFYNQKFSAEAT